MTTVVSNRAGARISQTAGRLAIGASAVALLLLARTTLLKIGLGVPGVGEAMAAVFDINQDALHNLARALGMLGRPVAAMLISVNLGRTGRWRRRLGSGRSGASERVLGAAG